MITLRSWRAPPAGCCASPAGTTGRDTAAAAAEGCCAVAGGCAGAVPPHSTAAATEAGGSLTHSSGDAPAPLRGLQGAAAAVTAAVLQAETARAAARLPKGSTVRPPMHVAFAEGWPSGRSCCGRCRWGPCGWGEPGRGVPRSRAGDEEAAVSQASSPSSTRSTVTLMLRVQLLSVSAAAAGASTEAAAALVGPSGHTAAAAAAAGAPSPAPVAAGGHTDSPSALSFGNLVRKLTSLRAVQPSWLARRDNTFGTDWCSGSQ